MHEVAAEKDPGERDDERSDDQHVSIEGGAVRGGLVAGAAEGDERDSGGGPGEGDPSNAMEALAGEQNRSESEDHGHGSHHQSGVADCGQGEAIKLDHELDRDAQEGGEQHQEPVFAAEARGPNERQQSEAGEEESVEHHVADVEFGECDLAEVEAGAPAGSSQRAGAVAEESGGGWRT